MQLHLHEEQDKRNEKGVDDQRFDEGEAQDQRLGDLAGSVRVAGDAFAGSLDGRTLAAGAAGGGKADAQSAMVVIQWKQRPKELQEKVAKALADLLLAEGSRPVEIIYQNLDMDDFYEYKGE